jgi:hypothetical protein
MNTSPKPDPLDRILSTEVALLPSLGFSESVMLAVQEQASAPAPFPFPWKFALPGMALLLVGFIALCRLFLPAILSASQSPSVFSEGWAWLLSGAMSTNWLRVQAAPAALAIAGSWCCVLLCRRLAGGRSAR